MLSNEPMAQFVGGPKPLAVGCVTVRLRVDGQEFPAMMLPDRTIAMPEWVQAPLRQAASNFFLQFERGHRVVIHQLLKRARDSIRAGDTQRGVGIISEKPIRNRGGELVFHIVIDDVELVLHISNTLTPSEFHANQDSCCDITHLFRAYDTALDYMQDHTDEIAKTGFDMTILGMSILDWEGYRERLRLV